MDHSKVYQRIHFLLYLKDAPVTERQMMITNITPGQLDAIIEVIVRIVNGIVSPLRRDVQLFHRRQRLFRTITSSRVSFTRKKALLRRHHSIVPIILRTPYLIQVILHEARTTVEE